MYIVYTDQHKQHATDKILRNGQPFTTAEVPARAEIILKALQSEQLGILKTPVDHGLEPIQAVHDLDYINFLQKVYDESANYFHRKEPVFPEIFAPRHPRRKPNRSYLLNGYYAFGTGGTPILDGTWSAAYWSAQCALTAADLIYQDNNRNECRGVYALCRPPGHHASNDLYGGYCYLNNAAIAARYLENVSSYSMGEGLRSTTKISILDIDYHHCNGTQEIFYSDPAVLVCSIHAHPDDHYPFFWGGANEIGEGPGKGYNHNWPLPAGTDDYSYLAVLDIALKVILDFHPNFLIVSAGFDAADGDPICDFRLTPKGFFKIGKKISSLNLPTIIIQEGGYLLDKLGENAVSFLKAFA